MATDEESYINIYKRLAKIPEIMGAEITSINDGANCEPIIAIETQFQCRDMAKLQYLNTRSQYVIYGDHVAALPAVPVASDTVLERLSPSGNLRAQVIQNAADSLLQIVSSGGAVQVIHLKEMDLHGKAYCDPYISCLEWSTDEEKIAFVAEKKTPNRTSFYSQRKEKFGKEIRGEKYLFQDDWGEQMIGQHQGVIVIAEVKSGDVTVLPLPDNLTPGELVWVPNSDEIVGVANISEPFKIGLAYCSDRESFLFCIGRRTGYTELTERGQHVKYPRFDWQGEKLIYQKSHIYGQRVPAAQLYMMTWATKKEELIIDYVNKSQEISNGVFRGICGQSLFPRRCFDRSGRRVIFSAFSQSSLEIFIVDLDTKMLSKISHPGSCIVHDILNDWCLVVKTSLIEPMRLYLAKMPNPGEENAIRYLPITPEHTLNGIGRDWFSMWEFPSPTKDQFGNDVVLSAVYIGPTKSAASGEKKRPLICKPHGGPHTLTPNVFTHSLAFFVHLGYSIILPNYRGSIGHGSDFLSSSLGQCGTADVEDCYLTVTDCISRFPDVLDATQLYAFGLSHGGFLTSHLAARYPDTFKAAALVNAALDIYEMSVASDIPEWAYLEYGLSYNLGRMHDKESILRMYERSPVHFVDRVKTPILICLGQQDVRVPPSMGLNYHRMLLAQNIPTKVYIYDDDHPLQKVSSESDYIIQIAKWFSEHRYK